MKSGNFSTSVGVFLIVVAVATATGSDASLPHGESAAVGSAASQESPSFLGYRVGEERRYVLGPPQELFAQEHASWSIHLRELLGDPPTGVFELTHLWQRAASRSAPPIGLVVRVDSAGELRVNGYGFPIELRFTTERQLAGLGVELYTIRYRFEDGTFHKHTTMGGVDLEHAVKIRHNDDLDLSVPTGLYASAPTALNCLFTQQFFSVAGSAAVPQQGSIGSNPSLVSPTDSIRGAEDAQCSESLFSNPGLISLMLPVLWEEGNGEHRYLVLTPAGPFGMPGLGGQALGMSAQSRGAGFDSRQSADARTNSDIDTLRYIERVRVDIGRRKRDAWRFDGMRAFDALYVDDDGVVLRADLATRVSNAMSLNGLATEFDPMDDRPLWIRLLFPSEY